MSKSIADQYEYFTVRKGSEADKAIDEFLAKRKIASDECFKWARSKGSYSKKLLQAFGNVRGLYFSKGREPKDWIACDVHEFWKPHSKKCAADYRAMKKLPKLPNSSDLSICLGTNEEFIVKGGFIRVSCGLEDFDGKRVVSIHPQQKRPTVKGLSKITMARYWSLKEAA